MKKIVIDKPCTVKWGSMKKTPGGRFCDVCSHEVRDYSDKSKDEIIAMTEELSTQKFCARFNEEHVIILDKGQSPKKLYRYLAAFIMFALMLLGCKTKKKTTYSTPRFLSFDEDPFKTEQTAKNGMSKEEKNQ